MTGKENYTRASEFKGPAFLPCEFWVNMRSGGLSEKDKDKRQRLRLRTARLPDDELLIVNPKDFGVDQAEPHAAFPNLPNHN